MLKTPLSYFSEQDGNALTAEEKIDAIVVENIWPVELTDEDGETEDTCNNEQELRDSLTRRGIL